MQKTKFGSAIRATRQDREAAQAIGINIKKVYTISFGIGISLTGIAGVCLGILFPIAPGEGLRYVLIAFVAVAITGLGNIWGAFVGGIIVGVIYNLSGTYIAPQLAPAVCALVFIIFVTMQALKKWEQIRGYLKGE